MAGGQWEVVGKAKKPKNKGNASKIPTKDKHKEVAEIGGPIVESQTLYNAFLEKERKEVSISKPKEVAKPPEKNSAPTKKKSNKGDKKQPHAPKTSIEEAFKQVTEEELKNHIATLEVLYPNSPLLYLKDLASYLNVKLDLPIEDLTFASKPLGYPSVLLPKKSNQVIVKLFKRCSPQTLQTFYEFCLQNMVQDTLKGIHTIGYRVMLQCLAHEVPSVVLANLPKCSELCNTHQNRQNICLSILWAAGQAANNNLEAGFRVWVDLMFPLIGSKNCTAFAVDFLEKLLSGDDVMKCNKSLLDVRDLFPILDFIYSKELVKNVQKRLLALYPTLKSLSYGPEPENVLRNYFPSYLHRLGPQSPQPLKEEILKSLMYCLEKDTRCYSIWRQLYSKQYSESARLIYHINEMWENVPSKFPKRYLRDTLSAFQVTNEELNTSNKSTPSVRENTLVVKELLSKLNAGSFSWVRLVCFLILAVGSVVAYDMWLHKSFAASVTGKFMKDSGLLAVSVQASEKLQYFYGKVSKLCQKYFPVVTSWCKGTLLPFMELTVSKMSEIASLMWKSTLSLRVWCSQNIPPLLQVLEDNFVLYFAYVSTWSRYVLVMVSKGTLFVLAHVLDSANAFAEWVQSSPEMMSALQSTKTFLVSMSVNIKDNAVYLIQMAKNYFPIFPA